MKTTIYFTLFLVILMVTSCDLYEDIFDTNEDQPLTVTDADGNVYATVAIGSQVWMAENLKSTKYRDSSAIYCTTCPTIWASLTKGAYCWYKNDAGNKTAYGALYNWHAVKTGKLCPKGWHVPTREDWAKLEHHLGGSSVAGNKLKSVTGWNTQNSEVSNSSRFSALPGGLHQSNGSYQNAGTQGYWWSYTEDATNNAWCSYLVLNSSYLTTGSFQKTNGFSIRCIKD